MSESKIKMSTDTPVNTVKSLINVLYYKNGNYEDYKKLFINPNRVSSEKEVNYFREHTILETEFPVDYKDVNNVVKHLKAVCTDDDAVVYWLMDADKAQDTKNNDVSGSRTSWNLVKKNDEWLVKNYI